MCVPVVSSDAAVMAAVLLDTAALIEESGAAGFSPVMSHCRYRPAPASPPSAATRAARDAAPPALVVTRIRARSQ